MGWSGWWSSGVAESQGRGACDWLSPLLLGIAAVAISSRQLSLTTQQPSTNLETVDIMAAAETRRLLGT
jgi:hypothetical protein